MAKIGIVVFSSLTRWKQWVKFIRNLRQMNVIENNTHAFVLYYMMKRSFSILLSFILLASHMSFTIGTHSCGGEAVEKKLIFGESHLGCDMMDMEESCTDSENVNYMRVSFDKTPCCENEYETVQAIDEFVKGASYPTFNVDFAVAIIYTSFNLDLFPKTYHQFYTEYLSIPIEKDIQVLFQTYLI